MDEASKRWRTGSYKGKKRASNTKKAARASKQDKGKKETQEESKAQEGSKKRKEKEKKKKGSCESKKRAKKQEEASSKSKNKKQARRRKRHKKDADARGKQGLWTRNPPTPADARGSASRITDNRFLSVQQQEHHHHHQQQQQQQIDGVLPFRTHHKGIQPSLCFGGWLAARSDVANSVNF